VSEGSGQSDGRSGGGAGVGSDGWNPAPAARSDPAAANPLLSQPIEFVGSFPDPNVRVEPPLPEIAFIGRSNVGKSSLLNALVGRPGLARVSSSPGKTTLLNFYRLPGFYLVDLPGYGFARASKAERAGYRKLVTGYLRTRHTLRGIVWLLDIRHDPSKEDREMQQLLIESGRAVLAVFTKADKLTRSAVHSRREQLARSLQLQPEQVEVTSSRSGTGIAELAASVLAATTEGLSS
jgi:GTP-binding protein